MSGALHYDPIHAALAGSRLCPAASPAFRCTSHEQTTIEFLNDFADVLLQRISTDNESLDVLARIVAEVVCALTAPPPSTHLSVESGRSLRAGLSGEANAHAADYEVCAAHTAHASVCRACRDAAGIELPLPAGRQPGIF
jgi:hypothetical protein